MVLCQNVLFLEVDFSHSLLTGEGFMFGKWVPTSRKLTTNLTLSRHSWRMIPKWRTGNWRTLSGSSCFNFHPPIWICWSLIVLIFWGKYEELFNSNFVGATWFRKRKFLTWTENLETSWRWTEFYLLTWLLGTQLINNHQGYVWFFLDSKGLPTTATL